MDKVIRNGKVAIVYGSYWFTNHGCLELVFHPKIVELIEQNKRSQINKALVADILNIDKEDCPCLLSAIGLDIVWVDVGTTFTIKSFEGEEEIITYDEFRWLTA